MRRRAEENLNVPPSRAAAYAWNLDDCLSPSLQRFRALHIAANARKYNVSLLLATAMSRETRANAEDA